MPKKRYYIEPPKQRPIILNPDIKRGVVSILLFLLAGISVLSFFKVAGIVGVFIDDSLSLLFGVTKYAVPVVLAAIAIMIEKQADYDYKSTHAFGFVLFFLGLNGLIHILSPFEELFSQAMQGYGGGLFGLALSWPLLKYFGFWAGIAVLVAVILVSILFLFNTSLAALIDSHKKLLNGLGGLGSSISFFPNLFRRAGIRIKGDYNVFESEDLEEEYGENAPNFKKKSIDEEMEDGAESDFENETEEDESETVKKSEFMEFVAGPPAVFGSAAAHPAELALPVRPPMQIKALPSLNLLLNIQSKPTAGDIKSNAAIIQETLKNFGLEVDMGEVRVGPTVTQYSLKPAKGVKLARITGLSNDLALALAAHPIRIEAPIPGQSYVGIEVPNQRVALVTLRELLTSKEFAHRQNNMEIALGKDVAGKEWFADLTKMPHLLVAGATGSGKTVCINSIIMSLLFENTPETLRFILVDPKRVELPAYNGIPHLLTPVITDVPKTISALKWTIAEMDRRFDFLAKAGVRDIHSFNKKSKDRLPYIVFVIDELADLMAAAGAEMEAGIIRIAQMARAVGIHLILATQRPSTDVITGLIKANIPARIAFSVASLVDSRTILDSSGAEKLLGRGDMLFLTAELSKPKRIQGCLVSEEEVRKVVDYLKGDDLPSYDMSIVESAAKFGAAGVMGGAGIAGGSIGGVSGGIFGGERDPLFDEAKRLIIESGKASASFLQRRLKLGYARAARILDELELAGIVGPGEGAKPREVLAKDMEDAEIIEDRQYFEDEAAEEAFVGEGDESFENEDNEDKDIDG